MILRALVLLLGLGTGLAVAQLPEPTPLPKTPPAANAPPTAPSPSATLPAPPLVLVPAVPPAVAPVPLVPPSPPPLPQTNWVFSGEWLHWWTNNVATPPLLTTSSPVDNGIIGRPSTIVLAGGKDTRAGGDVRPNGINGMRFQARYDSSDLYGAEIGGFYATNGAAYNNVYSSVLAVPYVDASNGQNASLVLANTVTNGPTGYATVQDYAQLYGFEAMMLGRLLDDGDRTVELLAGARYLMLYEDFLLQTLTKTNTTATFVGLTQPSGTTFVGMDEFLTRNHFIGVHGGARGRWRSGRVTVEGTGTIAIGTTHREVTILGNTSVNIPQQLNALGYVFSQPTNIGRRSDNVFGVVPQGRVTVAYNVFDLVRIFIGCDALYWSSVARPGSQMQANISPSLIPLVTAGPQTGSQPLPRIAGTDYWALGLSLGLDLSF